MLSNGPAAATPPLALAGFFRAPIAGLAADLFLRLRNMIRNAVFDAASWPPTCDGSVRFVPNNIALATWQTLSTMNDGRDGEAGIIPRLSRKFG